MPTQPIVLVGSAARTATGTGDQISLDQFANRPVGLPPMLIVQSDVTAASGRWR